MRSWNGDAADLGSRRSDTELALTDWRSLVAGIVAVLPNGNVGIRGAIAGGA